MDRAKIKEEYLEFLWYARENDDNSLDQLAAELGDRFDPDLLNELCDEGLATRSASEVMLTDAGVEAGRTLIRSHRLAERLVHDVLGVEYEQGACEFEHIVNTDLVDSICTLLGHPRECPHGMPIPAGECCKQQAQSVESSVISLSSLAIGETAKIAYVYAKNDNQLHKLDNLLIRPGVELKLHQTRPSIVIECEGTMVAIDDAVADSIYVWTTKNVIHGIVPHGRRRQRRGLRHGFKHGTH